MDFARYRPHIAATLSLGLPIVGSYLARMAIGVSDTIMVGWYGPDELASLILATSFINVLMFLGLGFGVSVMGVIAAGIARGDETEVRRATRMALWLSIFYGLLMLPLLIWSEAVLLWLGQKPILAALAQDYLRIAGIGLLLVLCQITMNSYLAALERTQVVLWVTLAGLPVNVFLNWILIFGNLGAPEMGVKGAAVASVFTQAVQLGVIMAYAHWLPSARRFHLFQRFWKPDNDAMRRIFWLGLPVGVTALAEGALFVASNVLMGWIGRDELAGHGIALQISSITFMMHLGLSNAATVRVGQAYGRGDQQGMRDAGVTVTMISLGFACLASAVFILFPRTLAAMFLDPAAPSTPAIVAFTAGLMFYAALYQITDAMQVVTMGLLRGVQDTRVPMYIAGFAYWVVGMPVAYGLAFGAGIGPVGIWLGLVTGLATAAVLLMVRFWRGWARGAWVAHATP